MTNLPARAGRLVLDLAAASLPAASFFTAVIYIAWSSWWI